MRKINLLCLVMISLLIVGCTQKSENGSSGISETETVSETEDFTTKSEEDGFETVAKLLGQKDSDTAELLGGGEENWSEDRSHYIGRVFHAELYGEVYPVYTTCNDDKVVDSVAVWIVNGERSVEESEIEEWLNRISDDIGEEAESKEDGLSAGSVQYTWRKEGKVVTLRSAKDSLTLSFQNAVGEMD